MGKDIAYIKIEKFQEKTYDEFIKVLDDLTKKGAEKLILDLRDNTGGIMESAVKIAGIFLKQNTEVVRIIGKNKKEDNVYIIEKNISNKICNFCTCVP